MTVGRGKTCTENSAYSRPAAPPTAVVYVENETCTGLYSPFENEYPATSKCGNVYVHGTYSRAADDRRREQHHHRRQPHPHRRRIGARADRQQLHPHLPPDRQSCTESHEEAAVGRGCETVTESQECENASGSGRKTSRSKRRSWRSTTPSSSTTTSAATQLGNLTVIGAIAQNYRGAVGTDSGGTGYLKNYNTTNASKTIEPPSFIEPGRIGLGRRARDRRLTPARGQETVLRPMKQRLADSRNRLRMPIDHPSSPCNSHAEERKALVGLEIETGSIAATEVRANGSTRVTATAIGPLAPTPSATARSPTPRRSPTASSALLREQALQAGPARRSPTSASSCAPCACRRSRTRRSSTRLSASRPRSRSRCRSTRRSSTTASSAALPPTTEDDGAENRRDRRRRPPRHDRGARWRRCASAGLQPVGIDLSAFGMIRALGEGVRPAAATMPPSTERRPLLQHRRRDQPRRRQGPLLPLHPGRPGRPRDAHQRPLPAAPG